MILQNNSLKEIYDAIMPHIENLINQTPEEIIKTYPDNEINLLTLDKKHVKQERLEIRFEDELATLTCEFDGKNLCKTINIFTDSSPTVEE
ncbi:MAG: hypothetical protein LIO65_01255, partial [Odoribacter sp.]|nr:hypothetical protein [Odoribacter sp.]